MSEGELHEIEAEGPRIRATFEAARQSSDWWRRLAASPALAAQYGISTEEIVRELPQAQQAETRAHIAAEQHKVAVAMARQALDREPAA